MWGPPPRPSKATDKLKEPKPKNIREVPGISETADNKILLKTFLHIQARMGRQAVDPFRNARQFGTERYLSGHRLQ